jgi:hypothetical protein
MRRKPQSRRDGVVGGESDLELMWVSQPVLYLMLLLHSEHNCSSTSRWARLTKARQMINDLSCVFLSLATFQISKSDQGFPSVSSRRSTWCHQKAPSVNGILKGRISLREYALIIVVAIFVTSGI